jgi:ABC-type multidrug transport system fused ATPase/permease subunit
MAGIASSINNAIYNSSADSSSEAKFSRAEMEILVDVVNHLHDDELHSFADDDVDRAMRTYEMLLSNSTAGEHELRGRDEEQHLQSRINQAMAPDDRRGFFGQFTSGNLTSWNPLRVRDVYNKTTRDYLWEVLSPLGSLITSGGAIAAIMREISVRVALAAAGATPVLVGAFLIIRTRYKDNQVRLNKKLMSSLKSLAKARLDLKKTYAKLLIKLNGDLGGHVMGEDKRIDANLKLYSQISALNTSNRMQAFLAGGFTTARSSNNPRIMIENNSWYVDFDEAEGGMRFTMQDVEAMELLA